MNEALQYAQQWFAPLPGYQRMRVESGTRTLVARFAFPDVAQVRYAPLASQVEATTGWHVRFHPIAHQEALAELAARLLPTGLTIMEAPSIYHDAHLVGLTCIGEASAEAIQAAQMQFLQETGWQLTMVGPATNTLGEEHPIPRLEQAEAMGKASDLFRNVPGLYQVGADARRKALWLYFHFPEIARVRYAEQLATLTHETGWSVELHKNAHKKALVELAQHLLSPHLTLIGKKAVDRERKTLRLTGVGELDPGALETLRRRFTEQTAWSLEVVVAQGVHPASAAPVANRMPEVEVHTFIRAQVALVGQVERVGVDAVRGRLLVVCQGGKVTDAPVAEWESLTGWKIELASSNPET